MTFLVDAIINFNEKQHFDNYTRYFNFAVDSLERDYGIVLDELNSQKSKDKFGYKSMKYVRQMPRQFRNFPMFAGEDINAFLSRQNLAYGRYGKMLISNQIEKKHTFFLTFVSFQR